MCGRGIKNSVVGIIGCGNIGTSIAKKLSTFQISKLLYTSRNEKPAGNIILFVFIKMFLNIFHLLVKAIGGKLVTVDELVEQSDFIILAIAMNDDTKFIINEKRIAKMKSHAVLVNIGRGGKAHFKHYLKPVFCCYCIRFSGLIDQDALIKALKENKIGAAGLDVMTPEPLPLDSPLMKMDNVGM